MFEEILKEIKPDKEFQNYVDNIVKELKENLENNGLEIFIGGSYGKGTWLKNDFDIDMFALFDKDDKISNKVEDVLKKLNLNYIRVKGSRDYFKIYYKDIEFELVPILKIDNPLEAKIITDVSPFHVKYIKNKIDEKMEDEIRLLKYFFKNYNLYGAESYVKGYSGYVTELLIIYYKSFENFLKNASNWKPKVIIDIENYYKDFNDIKRNLNKDKLRSPLIIIDPVNKYRNASAVLSIDIFSKTIYYSRITLDLKKFLNIKLDEKEIIEKSNKYGTLCIKILLEGKGESKDIKNTKALTFLRMFERQLNINGYKIFKDYIEFQKDKLLAYILIYPGKLPEYEIREGPILWDIENYNKFYEKHKNEEIFIRNSKIYSITKRKINNIKDYINYFKEAFRKNIEEKLNYIEIKFLNG